MGFDIEALDFLGDIEEEAEFDFGRRWDA